MRFDDSLATVLSAATASAEDVETAWRQIVDLIGHGRAPADAALLDGLRVLGVRVSATARTAAARALADADPPVDLILLLAEEEAAVRPLIRVLRLTDEAWAAIIPRLGPVLRATLRARDDLPGRAKRALAVFGGADLALRGPTDVDGDGAARMEGDPDPYPIPNLLDRIAGVRSRLAETASGEGGRATTELILETDPEGIVVGVSGGPRAPLIGLSIAHAAEADRTGVDGESAQAVRERRAIEGGRLIVGEGTPVGGAWHLWGAPRFDGGSGRFLGYRCLARRALPASDTREQTETLRVLIHELRTPANAMTGFAELMESQLMGPVPPEQRRRAASIRLRALELLNAVDDLDAAARIEADALDLKPGRSTAGALMARAVALASPQAKLRGVELGGEPMNGDVAVAGDERVLEWLLTRVLTLAVSVGEGGERFVLTARDAVDDQHAAITTTRPRAWRGLDRATLQATVATERGPLLGVGFCLDLLERLAARAGVALILTEDRFGAALRRAADG